MKAHILKKWMESNHKTTADVASMSKVSVRTIERFLTGKTIPHKIVMDMLEVIVKSDDVRMKSEQNH